MLIHQRYEIAGGDVDAEDLDLLSERLALLLESPEIRRFNLLHLDMSIPQGEARTLSSTHERLLQYWVASLPEATPLPTRTALARRVRKVAVEVFLSQIGINAPRTQRSVSSEQGPEALQSNSFFELPIHTKLAKGKEKEARVNDAANNREGLSGLPLRNISQVSRNAKADTRRQEHSAVTRLSDFVQFESRKTLPKSLMPLIDRWKVGGTPDEYIWTEQQTDMSPSEEDEDHPSAKQRGLLDRSLKRQRQKTIGFSSAPVAKRSPQIHGQRPIPNSQISDGPVVMTQPEPGTHGSRKQLKKGNKPRKPGFR